MLSGWGKAGQRSSAFLQRLEMFLGNQGIWAQAPELGREREGSTQRGHLVLPS